MGTAPNSGIERRGHPAYCKVAPAAANETSFTVAANEISKSPKSGGHVNDVIQSPLALAICGRTLLLLVFYTLSRNVRICVWLIRIRGQQVRNLHPL